MAEPVEITTFLNDGEADLKADLTLVGDGVVHILHLISGQATTLTPEAAKAAWAKAVLYLPSGWQPLASMAGIAVINAGSTAAIAVIEPALAKFVSFIIMRAAQYGVTIDPNA